MAWKLAGKFASFNVSAKAGTAPAIADAGSAPVSVSGSDTGPEGGPVRVPPEDQPVREDLEAILLNPEVSRHGGEVPPPLPRAARSSSAKRRIGKLSEQLSHATVAGLLAIAVLPAARPSPFQARANVQQGVATPAPARAVNDPAQSGREAPVAKPSKAIEPIKDRMVTTDAVTPGSELDTHVPYPPSALPPDAARGKDAGIAAKPMRTAAMVAPVKREAPRVMALTATPDEHAAKPEVKSALLGGARPDLKRPKGKLKTVKARSGGPDKTIKSEPPPQNAIAVASVKFATVAAVEPELLPAALPHLPKITAKTVSERKAKADSKAKAMAKGNAGVDTPKPQRVVTIEPVPSKVPAAPPIAGITTRAEKTTVVEAWSAEQIAEGRKSCQALLKDSDVVASDAPPLKEGACGAPAPVVVRRVGAPKVDIQPAAMMTCPMAASLNTWIAKAVQPAALEHFGVPVVRLLSASSYSCRNRYGQANTQLSEHALVNALDLSGFVLADGRIIRVVESWGPVARDAKPEPVKVAEASANNPERKSASKSLPKPGMMRLGTDGAATLNARPDTGSVHPPSIAEARSDAKTLEAGKRSAFLRKVHQDACGTFGTVLGPEANDAHRNHFHLDMMARRHTSFCQ